MLLETHQYTNSPTNPKLLIVECGLMALSIAAAYAWPRLGAPFFARSERAFARLAHRKGLAVAVTGMSVILFRLAILPLFPVPHPIVPDDFSFLLAADTFAHGRLTNPTPAMWTHFESVYITMQPTYQSIYFPGEGLILAAGKAICGNPWIGQLIVSALMCAMLCWALQAWLPANWALLGGFIAVLRLGVFSYWTNSYHAAGSLSALGGALILGALPRLMKTVRLRYGLLMGLGIAILVLTRPYEGLLLCLPVGIMLGRWLWKGENRPSTRVLIGRAALSLVVVVAAIAWLGYYDYRAFGNPLTLPYTVGRSQYAISPLYVWQPLRPEPAYRHEDLRRFYHFEIYGERSIPGFVKTTLSKAGFMFLFYAGFTLLPPLIMVRRVFLDRRVRFFILCSLILAAGAVIEVFSGLPHYAAPFTVAFYAIGLQAMRHLRLWKPEGRPAGVTMVRFTVASCALLAGLRIFATPLGMDRPEWPPSNWNFVWSGPNHYGEERAGIESKLEAAPGKQLVIVRYAPWHYPFDEWVYNAADIDAAKVVWARDMNPADNLELIRYYGDRTVWLAQPDQPQSIVVPYPMQR
jgi:hypothetical protein